MIEQQPPVIDARQYSLVLSLIRNLPNNKVIKSVYAGIEQQEGEDILGVWILTKPITSRQEGIIYSAAGRALRNPGDYFIHILNPNPKMYRVEGGLSLEDIILAQIPQHAELIALRARRSRF